MKHTLTLALAVLIAGPVIISAQTPTDKPSNGEDRSNAAPQPATTAQATSATPTNPAAASMSGRIIGFTTSGFTFQAASEGVAIPFLTSVNTIFTDVTGMVVAREFFTAQTPAVVFYVRTSNQLLATKVVANAGIASVAAGTITGVGKGLLDITVSGATSPVRFINNEATAFVDINGAAAPLASVRPGALVKVFYSKVGSTFLASKIQVQ